LEGIPEVAGSRIGCHQRNRIDTWLRISYGGWVGRGTRLPISKVPEVSLGIDGEVLNIHGQWATSDEGVDCKLTYDRAGQLKVYFEEGVIAVWAIIGGGDGGGGDGEVRVSAAAGTYGLIDGTAFVEAAGAPIHMLLRERASPERRIDYGRKIAV